MFAHVFFLRLGQVKQEDYGFHDPDQSAPFQSVAATFQNLYALGFLGDYDNDAFPDPADIFFADLFVFGVIVVLLNVLIAIVNESYAKAMGQKEELFWRARLQLVTQAEDVAGWVFRSNFFPSDLLGADYTAIVKEELVGSSQREASRAGRVANITSAVREDLRSENASLEKKFADSLKVTETKMMEAIYHSIY